MKFNIQDIGIDVIESTLDRLLLGYNSSEYAGIDDTSERAEITQNYLTMKQILRDFQTEK